jgi:hypothetical protein
MVLAAQTKRTRATAIRYRAEMPAGELIAEMEKHKGSGVKQALKWHEGSSKANARRTRVLS